MTAIDARERDCPVLPCVPFTTVNADLVTAEDVLAPAPAEARPERLGLALVVISTAQLMVVLDATIVTVALPSIQRALHFSTADLQWVLSAYTLTFGGLLLFGGRLGDVLGRRRMFVVGLLLFAGASLAGGLATTSAFLVAARAVQGCGAAIAAPTALSLIGDTFEEGPARTRAMGVYAAMSGAGSAIGLLVGGLLTDVASWRWVFFINVPIGAAVALAAPRVLPKSVGRGGHLDVPGAITVTTATTALVYGLIRAPSDGWADAITVACLVGAALLYAVFVLVETNSTSPLLPFRLFANRNRAAAYVVMLCTAAAIFAVFFFLTQILQNVFGYSPIVAGLAFLPFSLGIAVTSEFVAKFLEKVGPRVFASVGPFLCALGLVWLSRIGVHSTYGRDILGPTLLLSIGLGCTFVPLTLAATSRVASADLGIASALLNSAQQIGGTIGLAVLVTVAATVTRNWLTSHVTSAPARTLALNSALHGYRAAFLVGAAIATVGGFVALAAIRVTKPNAQRTTGA
jgi:EmrB/QacA subfamily drug resistance transporter